MLSTAIKVLGLALIITGGYMVLHHQDFGFGLTSLGLVMVFWNPFNRRKVGLDPIPPAITFDDSRKYGCPHCGYCLFQILVRFDDTELFKCQGCENTFLRVTLTSRQSSIGFNGVFPKAIKHPRWGVPANGDPNEITN